MLTGLMSSSNWIIILDIIIVAEVNRLLVAIMIIVNDALCACVVYI